MEKREKRGVIPQCGKTIYGTGIYKDRYGASVLMGHILKRGSDAAIGKDERHKGKDKGKYKGSKYVICDDTDKDKGKGKSAICKDMTNDTAKDKGNGKYISPVRNDEAMIPYGAKSKSKSRDTRKTNDTGETPRYTQTTQEILDEMMTWEAPCHDDCQDRMNATRWPKEP